MIVVRESLSKQHQLSQFLFSLKMRKSTLFILLAIFWSSCVSAKTGTQFTVNKELAEKIGLNVIPLTHPRSPARYKLTLLDPDEFVTISIHPSETTYLFRNINTVQSRFMVNMNSVDVPYHFTKNDIKVYASADIQGKQLKVYQGEELYDQDKKFRAQVLRDTMIGADADKWWSIVIETPNVGWLTIALTIKNKTYYFPFKAK